LPNRGFLQLFIEVRHHLEDVFLSHEAVDPAVGARTLRRPTRRGVNHSTHSVIFRELAALPNESGRWVRHQLIRGQAHKTDKTSARPRNYWMSDPEFFSNVPDSLIKAGTRSEICHLVNDFIHH